MSDHMYMDPLVGDLAFEGLQQEVEECESDEVVDEEYMRTLELLSERLKLVEDVEDPELEKLRQKAISKVYDFLFQKLIIALRKLPKTNIQSLQQSMLLKYRSIISFLKEHGKEVFMDVRAAYIDTMNKVLSEHFRVYIQALEKLQLDIATSDDLIGVETRSTCLLSRAREPPKYPSAVFVLGERIKTIKEIDQPALMMPHIASSLKYPYEELFRSFHKLLMDTATSEYIFCDDFFGEESMFYEIFAGPVSVVDEHFSFILSNCFDAISLMLMIRINNHHKLIMSGRGTPCLDSYLDKVNTSLWHRFKMVFDSHLNSLGNANINMLWEEDVHPHYVMRRYAEFTASFIHLNVEYGDAQPDIYLERLRVAVDGIILKLATLFPKPKQQTVFLINNYDMIVAVLKEAGAEGGRIHMHFEELLKSNISSFVEELHVEHFSDLVKFVKGLDDHEMPITVAEVEPLVRNFEGRWKTVIELMHNDCMASFSNFFGGKDIWKASSAQLFLVYNRLTDFIIQRIDGGDALYWYFVPPDTYLSEARKIDQSSPKAIVTADEESM